MTRVVRPGLTYILQKPGDDTRHLWVVLTDPDDNDKVVIVNLTTRRSHSNDTVTLNRSDHRFVQRDTVIFYQDARLVKASALTNAVRGGVAIMHDPFRPNVLTDIQRGLINPPNTPNLIKEYTRQRIAILARG